MVELAICFTPFMLLTVGVLDVALAVYDQNFCYYAARQATRWASVHGANSATASDCSSNPGIASGCAANVSDVASDVKASAVAMKVSSMAIVTSQTSCSSNNTLTVCTTWTPDNTPGSEVAVTVSYAITPLSGLALKQGITLSSTSKMEMVH